MSLDRAAVAHIARLARLRISEDGQDKLANELSGILDWIEQLQEVDTSSTEPMSSAVEMALKMRQDVIDDGNKPADILANAPESDDGHYLVNKVIE